jgi:Protein of unknown function (DUF3293)
MPRSSIAPVNALLDQDVTQTPAVPHIATLPAIYMAAEYKWELDGQWWPIQIGAHAHALDAAFPDAARFGMLTASNPGYITRSDAENRAADRELQSALDQLGLRYRPGFAIARNRNWRAHNWLVIDPDESAFDVLGRQFGQIGTLLWSRGSEVRLRMRAARPETLTEHPYIDWIHDAVDARSASIEANPSVNT